jgi:hypothetical protein
MGIVWATCCFAAVWSAACWAEEQAPTALSTDEYKAVRFGSNRGGGGSDTEQLNMLARNGWEYVGPLYSTQTGGGVVAFRRTAVNAQRARIIGTWEAVADKEEALGRVEFTRDGTVKIVGGKVEILRDLFTDFKDADQLKYELAEKNRFVLREGTNGYFAALSFDDETLTIRRFGSGPTRTFKRIVIIEPNADRAP